jgi:hypothetical protein
VDRLGEPGVTGRGRSLASSFSAASIARVDLVACEQLEVRLVVDDLQRLVDEPVYARAFLPRTVHQAPFAEQLGCELEPGMLGMFYKTDAMKETTVPGVFACGDVALPMGTVAFAVADGVRAGVAAHQSLVFRR